eukprot:TRINITY_DN5336_c0_g2_i1.p1 TRINITY_DN5336_c0_g2~~TRINITY_DN5336_c0_g2_i1.p1  ORF type:complete len:580 (-),score=94.81 TRINITY_DN5336_c0_g2_i1:51-1790(-)
MVEAPSAIQEDAVVAIAAAASADEAEAEDAAGEAESEDDGRRRSRVGRRLIVNTAACTGKTSKDLFSLVAKELGFREVDIDLKKKSVHGSIYCVMQTTELMERLPIEPSSWVTRYVGLPDMCDKGNLARMYQFCEDLAEEGTFSFNPQTWILPDQLDDLRAKLEKSKKTYIVKPEDGSQGDGIFLVQGVRDLDIKISVKANKSGVAQKYLERPLLHRGFKFDFRVYVALVGGSPEAPPRIYLCKEGLARFCTEEYHEPSQSNMHKCMSHLTNYSLNKRSSLFEHGGETQAEVFSITTTASKRPLTVALQQIAEEHTTFDIARFYESVATLVGTTVSLMAPVLIAAGRDHHEGASLRSCQVLGFDIMMDNRFVPYLLEVNNSPSLCIDEALPVDPEEVAAHGAMTKQKGATRSSSKTTNVCCCMDMAQPHRHQTAFVDLAVKSTVMRSLFEVLSALSGGVQDPEHEDCIFIDVRDDEMYSILSRVEEIYSQNGGGAAKAFTSTALRRVFGSVCGRGVLEKHDLDSLGHRSRQSHFKTRELRGKPDSLRVFDYLDVMKQVAARAFPGQPPRAALGQVLSLL